MRPSNFLFKLVLAILATLSVECAERKKEAGGGSEGGRRVILSNSRRNVGRAAKTTAARPTLDPALVRKKMEKIMERSEPPLERTIRGWYKGIGLELSEAEAENDLAYFKRAAATIPEVPSKDEYSSELHQNSQGEPVEMARLESEKSKDRNIIYELMEKYRKDQGFNTVRADFVGKLYTRREFYDQLRPLFGCFRQEMPAFDEEICSSDPFSLTKIIEAFDFLRYIGLIPEDLSSMDTAQCQNLKRGIKSKNLEQMMEFYEKKLKRYTELQWDFLDLTPFKYQQFPVYSHIVKSYPESATDNYYRPYGVMSVLGTERISKYFDHLRFFNPDHIEDKRMLMFQDLYALYYKALKAVKKNPSDCFIDWSHCTVTNWPEGMSMYDIDSWTQPQLAAMAQLIESGGIIFVPCATRKRDGGILGKFPDKKVIDVEFSHARNDDRNVNISDSEEACGDGKHREAREKIAVQLTQMKEAAKKAKKCEEKKKKRVAKPRDQESKVQPKRRDFDDLSDDGVFDENHPDWNSSSASKPSKSPKSPKSPSVHSPHIRFLIVKNIKHVEVSKKVSIKRKGLTVAECENILKDATKVYKKDTGKDCEINWDDLQLSLFEYHRHPLPNGLKTNEDYQILKALLSEEYIAFLNPLAGEIDASIKTYERVYQIYLHSVDPYANPFDIFFEDLEVEGWPEGVDHEMDSWRMEDNEKINLAINANLIKMKANAIFQEEIDDVLKESRKSHSKSRVTAFDFATESKSSDDSPASEGTQIFSPSPKTKAKRLLPKSKSKKLTVDEDEDKDGDGDDDEEFKSPLPIPGLSTATSKKRRIQSKYGEFEEQNCSLVAEASEQIEGEENFDLPACQIVSSPGPSESSRTETAVLQQAQHNIDAYRRVLSVVSPDSRHYRILALMMECFEIIKSHVSGEGIEPLVSLDEAVEFLGVFKFALENIRHNGGLKVVIVKQFVIAAVKLRARQAGIPKGSTIPSERITNPSANYCLCLGQTQWDHVTLEFSLFHAEPLFTTI